MTDLNPVLSPDNVLDLLKEIQDLPETPEPLAWSVPKPAVAPVVAPTQEEIRLSAVQVLTKARDYIQLHGATQDGWGFSHDGPVCPVAALNLGSGSATTMTWWPWRDVPVGLSLALKTLADVIDPKGRASGADEAAIIGWHDKSKSRNKTRRSVRAFDKAIKRLQ